jgi:futalosine hydrolase
MHLLLCAATPFEIASTAAFIKAQQLDKQVTILFTGIGLVAATYSLTRQIGIQKPVRILQAGIAGSLDNQLTLGQTVIVESESIGDLGVQEASGFQDLFQMGFLGKDSDPYKKGYLINPDPTWGMTKLQLVKAVSVNEISTNTERIDYYHRILGAQVESMEGAALHFVGLQEAIPFLQLRSISNTIGERNKQAWKLQEAIENLNIELQKLLVKQLGL